MGCDIHLYVEVRIDDKWETVDKWGKDGVEYGDLAYIKRNYVTFAFLADVRSSGYDFFIADTKYPVAAFNTKGFPEDACREVRDEYDEDYGHTPSWLNLAELMEYPWNSTVVKKRGVIAEEELERFESYPENQRRIFKPNSWCASTSIQPQQSIEWEVAATDSCSDFLSKVLPVLGRLVVQRQIGLDDARIVFWFDN